jgi:putative pyoverdin transport system ATP-binding/permease protein
MAIHLILALATLYFLWLFLLSIWQIKTKIRIYRNSKNGSLLHFGALIFVIALLGYGVYRIPELVERQVQWTTWGSLPLDGFLMSLGLLFVTGVLILLQATVVTIWPKPGERPYVLLFVLSCISGMGHASVIFIINSVLSADALDQVEAMALYFVLSVVLFAWCQKIIRTKLISLTNSIVYEKRMELAQKILATSYQQLEQIEHGKLQASLNNDTENVSKLANLIVNVLTWSITILSGFVYLGFINPYALLASLLVVGIAALLFTVMGRSANALWKQTRDLQNHFFRFIQDLLLGFKELSLNRQKAVDFRQDMDASCQTYRDKRNIADIRVAHVLIACELLFIIVIGIVVFGFPSMFAEITSSQLRNYVVVFIYMTGPMTAILNAIPQLMQLRISWNRILEVERKINRLISTREALKLDDVRNDTSHVSIQLEAVTYQYSNHSGDSFTVGPIDYEFNSGEITFIIGGNGSGKSTLAKLLTGLYAPSSGFVKVNGVALAPEQLGQYYTAIFSDVYLFDKLYGIGYEDKLEAAQHYLSVLELSDKVQIHENGFSTIKLSTGQRKRLALLISYLEDKPICLFDEWAADQDPEYRRFFYEVLLPEMKEKGKCVIVITHDDRYFDAADQQLRMERGILMDGSKQPLPMTSA